MRIPNKFNGYSADNRRIYNNPALVVPFVANMGTGAAAAAALAEAAAAAAATAAATQAATTATTATQTAAPVLETTAGLPANQVSALTQGGINPAAAPPVAPPGTPLPPAQPLPPAGGTPFTPPTAPPPGTVPPGASDAFHAQEAARLKDYLNNSTASLDSAAKPTGLEKTFDFTRSVKPADFAESLGQPPADFKSLLPAADKPVTTGSSLLDGFNLVKKFAGEAYEGYKQAPLGVQLGSTLLLSKSLQDEPEGLKKDNYKRTPYAGLSETFEPGGTSKYLYGFADGGITGGPVEQMSNMNAIGGNEMYPMANIPRLEYANPVQQRPISENIMTMGGDTPTDPYTGQLKFAEGGYAEEKEAAEEAAQRKRYSQMMGNSGTNPEESLAMGQSIASRAHGKSASITGHGIVPRSRAQTLSSPNSAAQSEMAAMMKKYGIKATMPKTLDPQSGSAGAGESDYAGGGIAYGLGGYSDGGRLLKGPGDGVSDSIPAQIGDRQPARLADGEFVIPARIVSELGNGSTEAGARQLYAMMERIQKNRKKSVGKGKVAVDSKAKKHLPA
jgi:hypothetical protein